MDGSIKQVSPLCGAELGTAVHWHANRLTVTCWRLAGHVYLLHISPLPISAKESWIMNAISLSGIWSIIMSAWLQFLLHTPILQLVLWGPWLSVHSTVVETCHFTNINLLAAQEEKVGGSSKSLVFVLWGPWTLQSILTIHPPVVVVNRLTFRGTSFTSYWVWVRDGKQHSSVDAHFGTRAALLVHWWCSRWPLCFTVFVQFILGLSWTLKGRGGVCVALCAGVRAAASRRLLLPAHWQSCGTEMWNPLGSSDVALWHVTDCCQ